MRILTADSVREMEAGALMEGYVAAVLRGEDDSDFAVAARRELIDNHLFTAEDLDAEIDFELTERAAARREAFQQIAWYGEVL